MSPDQEQQHESGLEMGLGFFSPPPPPPPFFKREDQDGGDHESSSCSTGQITKLCARGHWRPAEDAKLRELVSQHGPHNWNLIAEKLQGRSGKSCRLRWFNQLDPRITRRAFSEEEEERLLAAHKAYGNKWAMIARLFPGRTDNAVKNHWHVLMARRQREQQQQQQQHSSSTGFRRRPKLLGLLSHGAPSQLHHHHQEDLSNACSGESTITAVAAAKEDRSVSINPTSANNMAIPAGFPNRSPSCLIATTFQQPQLFGFIMGSGEKKLQVQVVAGSEWHEKFGDSGSRTAFNGGGGASLMLQAMGGAQQPAAPSYSTASEASATESVANQHWSNANNEGSGEKKISFPFFDFLGVGAS